MTVQLMASPVHECISSVFMKAIFPVTMQIPDSVVSKVVCVLIGSIPFGPARWFSGSSFYSKDLRSGAEDPSGLQNDMLDLAKLLVS